MKKTMKNVMRMIETMIYALDWKIIWFSRKREKLANGPVAKAFWRLSKEYFAWDARSVARHLG